MSYENDAPVLCGNWLCGGPLDIQAASDADSRSGYPVPVTGTFVEGIVEPGRAHPLRFHFVYRAPTLCTRLMLVWPTVLPPEVLLPKVCHDLLGIPFSPYN